MIIYVYICVCMCAGERMKREGVFVMADLA